MKNREVSVYAEEFDYIVKIGYKKFLFKTAGPAINFARDAVGRQVSDNEPDEVCIVLTKRVLPMEKTPTEETVMESEVTAE